MYFSIGRHSLVFLIFLFMHFFFTNIEASIAADYNAINSLNQNNADKFVDEENFNSKYAQSKAIRNYFEECFMKRLKISCITEKASIAVENSMDMDLQLIPGVVLVRNELSVTKSTGREEKLGIDRLTTALSNFMDTHSLTLEYGDEARRRKRRRFGFLLAAMMGAAGITGGMMLKSIALIAGKALMVSKMALMLISIIGLKKLFQKDEHHEPSVVQVHTLHDEHDRNVNSAMYNIRHL